jgi:hypothetical protein
MSVEEVKYKKAQKLAREIVASKKSDLNKTVTAYYEEIRCFVTDKTIFLDGFDCFFVTLRRTYRGDITCEYYTRYRYLDADSVQEEIFPLGDLLVTETFANYRELIDLLPPVDVIRNIEIGTLLEFKPVYCESESLDERDYFALTYKVEWDGETRIEV